MKDVEVGKLLKTVAATWPRQAMSVATVESYAAGVRDLPCDLTTRAIDELRSTEDWLPSVARIRRKVYGLANFAPPTLEEAMREAERWLKWQQTHRLVVNESGIIPKEPYIHPIVVSTLTGVAARDGGDWMDGFRFVYKDNVASWKNMILSMNFDDVKEMVASE
jgi:hypothetical protein